MDAEQTCLARAGLASVDERDTTCGYAKQDRFWVTGTPNGESWEVYTVLADSPTPTEKAKASNAAPPSESTLPGPGGREPVLLQLIPQRRWRVSKSVK